MSSMVRNLLSNPVAFAAYAAAALGALSTPSSAQMSGQQEMRSNLVASQPTQIGAAIARWEFLQENRELSFRDYAGFALAYPEFPRIDILRIRAMTRQCVDCAIDQLADDEIIEPCRDDAEASTVRRQTAFIGFYVVHD